MSRGLLSEPTPGAISRASGGRTRVAGTIPDDDDDGDDNDDDDETATDDATTFTRIEDSRS